MKIKDLNQKKLIIYTGNLILFYCLILMTEIIYRQYELANETENQIFSVSSQLKMQKLFYLGGVYLGIGNVFNVILKLLRHHLWSLILGIILVTLFGLTINGYI